MPGIEFGCLPTIIGSMPHTDPSAACAQVTHYLKDIPVWPQLPKRTFMEDMRVQFSHGFPGVVLGEDSIYIDRSQNLDEPLEQVCTDYLENNIDKYSISPDYAAGLHSFLGLKSLSPLAVKGQITGPITWGLAVTDDSHRAIIYDDILSDVVARFLRLKASWQEKELRKISKNTIIFVDEPYMVSYSDIVAGMGSSKKVISLLEEVFRGIEGLKGVHCCGSTDWSVLLDTSADILSFDAYNYAQSLSLYPAEVKKFLERGGIIAWGITPNNEEALAKETVGSVKDRLEEAMAPFTRDGIRFKQLLQQGLLTPSCGLGCMATEEASACALELLAELSARIRKGYI